MPLEAKKDKMFLLVIIPWLKEEEHWRKHLSWVSGPISQWGGQFKGVGVPGIL